MTPYPILALIFLVLAMGIADGTLPPFQMLFWGTLSAVGFGWSCRRVERCR
jgi:hypothetical protein